MSNDEHETPDELFQKLNARFSFKLDAAASEKNHKCKKYFTKKDNALSLTWKTPGWVWLNPPYSRAARGIETWLLKAQHSVEWGDCLGVLCLIPADCSTKHFLLAWTSAAEITFLTPRLAFKGSKQGAKFSSMLVRFGGNAKQHSLWNWKKESFGDRS